MKFLAVLLITCILFLSSFTGIRNTAVPTMKADCCLHKKGKAACHQNKTTTTPNDDCGTPGCTMLFTCSLCGFLVVDPLIVSAPFTTPTFKPVSLNKIGHLSAYHPSNWKPPKNV